MIPSELEKLVKIQYEMGNRPYFVNCTCGTTVLGAFDPINPIADICDKYNLWLHVDVSFFGVNFSINCHAHNLKLIGSLGWWIIAIIETTT